MFLKLPVRLPFCLPICQKTCQSGCQCCQLFYYQKMKFF